MKASEGIPSGTWKHMESRKSSTTSKNGVFPAPVSDDQESTPSSFRSEPKDSLAGLVTAVSQWPLDAPSFFSVSGNFCSSFPV